MNKANRDNDYIEEVANNLLNNKLFDLFDKNQLKLVKTESGRREIGIDFYYQVFDINNRQVLFFDLQNKGTDKPLKIIKLKNHIQYGKISFSLELRHIRQYYYEITEPVLFVICDINNKKAYWYPIQLDNTVPDRLKAKEDELKAKKSTTKKPKLQIYIPLENEIKFENFNNLLKDIDYSREHQKRKHEFSISSDGDYRLIEEKIKEVHLIDKAYLTIQYFEGINILPTNVIIKLPFIKGSQYNTYIHHFSQKTENEDCYNLLSKISLKNETLLYEDGKEYVENQTEKLKTIINFFKISYINHLDWGGKKYKARICIHDLFTYSNCDCARCNFEILNFKKAERIIENQNERTPLFEQLRNGYASYLLGNFETSIKIYQNILNISNEQNNPILYIISKYNLLQLKEFIRINYFDKDRNYLLESIKVESLKKDEIYIKRTAPYFIDIFNWLNENKFYSDATWYIDEILDKARKMYFYDKYGTRYTHSKSNNLIASFLRFYSFLEYNNIIFDCFSEYESIATKVLESIFALHNIVNPNSSKYEAVGNLFIKMWAFHVSYDKAKELLSRYEIVKITTTGDIPIVEELNALLDNLNLSKSKLKKTESYYFKKKIERFISNTILICSRLDADKEEINSILSKVLKLSSDVQITNLIPFEGFNQLLHYRNDITKENTIEILNLSIKYDSYSANVFSLAVKNFVENASKKEIKIFILNFLEVDVLDKNIITNNDRKISRISYAISESDLKTKKTIKNIITNSLREKFDAQLYHVAVLFELIDFDNDFFEEFYLSVPDQTKPDEPSNFFNTYENFRLNQVINIMFKYKLPFTTKIQSLITRCKEKQRPYYEWLMNMDSFDYNEFNSFWVLEHQTKYYFEAFKKSKKLKKAIKKSLEENYIEGVAKFYINHLT